MSSTSDELKREFVEYVYLDCFQGIELSKEEFIAASISDLNVLLDKLMPTEEEAKKDCYPKEFVEWFVTEGQFVHRFIGVVMNPLDEAFDYWTKNIKK